MSIAAMYQAAARAIEPREVINMLPWAIEHIFTFDGKPYDHSSYPHLGAPGGPMDAFDCSQYRTINLQWGSRLGKSFFAQCALLKTADSRPCPMMLASADQKLAVEVTARTYGMLSNCERLRWQLRPAHRRRQDFIELMECRVYVAWARSVSTLADKAVQVGHANEIDKWEHLSTSKEADPLKLFSDRFKEFPYHKKIYESTPAKKNSSRIERARLASTNAAFWVPCLACGRYQPLAMSRVKYDKNDAMKGDKDIAHKTARYECGYCDAVMQDEHRGRMMRAGVWIPEGCGCDDDIARETVERWSDPSREAWGGWSASPWITGKPTRDGRDYGSLLSSLAAVSLSWGDIAAEWVDCQRNPQNLRNFINQWLGETWELIARKETWEKVGERIIDAGCPRGTVPIWASLLTCAIDRQGRDGGKFPWTVLAWGPGYRCHVVSYGECDTFAELEPIVKGAYPHADGKAPLKVSFTLFDSGFQPNGVYEFCVRMIEQGHQCWPCKGSSVAMTSDYAWSELGKNTSMPGMKIVMVDTIRSQCWIEARVFDAEENRQTTIHAGTVEYHQDFLEQILNDAAVDKLDSTNNTRESWQRINESIPNDYRDCWRYAWVAMLLFQGRHDIIARTYTTPKPLPQAEQPSRIRQLRIRR